MICDPVSSMSTEEHKPIYFVGYFVIVIFQQFGMTYTNVNKMSGMLLAYSAYS